MLHTQDMIYSGTKLVLNQYPNTDINTSPEGNTNANNTTSMNFHNDTNTDTGMELLSNTDANTDTDTRIMSKIFKHFYTYKMFYRYQ